MKALLSQCIFARVHIAPERSRDTTLDYHVHS